MAESYDAVIVGGGHNGLVAAGYLGRAGLRVLVVEARDRLGGPAGTWEFIPGYRTAVTNSPGSLEPRFVEELELRKHGLAFHTVDPTLVQPLERERLFVGHRDRARTSAQLDAFHPGDAAGYAALFAHVQSFADRARVSLFREPPTLAELAANLTSPEDQADFGELILGSASELAQRFLVSEEARTIVTTLATAGGPGSPSIPGTNMNLLMRPFSLSEVQIAEGYDPRTSTLRGSTGLPDGGMGAIVAALERSLRSVGGEVRTDAPVARIRSANGRTLGVTLENGDEIDAPVVISAVDPKTTIATLTADDPEWDGFRAGLRPAKNAEGAVKVVLALDGLPRWRSAEGFAPPEYSAAQFRVATSEQYLENAYADALRGEIPAEPVIFGLIPSLTSAGMAPEGHHVMSLNLNGPRRLARGDWASRKGEMIDNTVAVLSRWMPELPSMIVGSHCVTPDDFVSEFGLVDAEISHGEMLPGHMFWMRPHPRLADYRTPTAGLYLSGAGCWPGNFVSGIPGFNTAQAVLTDLRKSEQ